MHISSKSSGGSKLVCKPAIQLVVSQKQESYIKKISNYLAKCTELKKEKEITPFDKLSAEENLDLFDTLVSKMSNTIFAIKFRELGNTLIAQRDKFERLSPYKQCYTLMQIINILHANVLSGDLTALDQAKQSGITTINNKLQSSYKSTKIIHQSITGLFEQEIDLLK
jgi:CRISPR-associated endonuclease Csn1